MRARFRMPSVASRIRSKENRRREKYLIDIVVAHSTNRVKTLNGGIDGY